MTPRVLVRRCDKNSDAVQTDGSQVIAKKSTDLEVGDEKDLPRRADLCVNEVGEDDLK